jgi:hypothetical protein
MSVNKIICQDLKGKTEFTFDQTSIRDKNRTGYYYVHEDKLYVIWQDKAEIYPIRFDTSNVSSNEKYVLMSKVTYDKLQNNFICSIEDRLNYSTTMNPYDVWVINLESRTDRKEEIMKRARDQKCLNMHLLHAYKHEMGHYGCALSHMALISYAKNRDLPYIIVMEDDNAIQNIDKLKSVIDRLVKRNDWDIFNGSPSFYGIQARGESPIFTELDGEPDLVFSNWGQTTNFIIYNRNCYDKILNFAYNDHIDIFISK